MTVPDTGVLEPQHIAVDAWVRAPESPGRWRYVLSKGSVDCDHSAYGLYSGFSGGMAFYVSSLSQYTISPEVSSATVWDGGWHHVIGSYDGERVRLWIDGSQVGDGHADEHADRLHERQQGDLHRDLPRDRAISASRRDR